jgi:hypothetical protein
VYHRLAALSALVLVGSTALVVARASSAPAPAPPKRATDAERTSLAMTLASEEPSWRASSEESFPQDNWSQRDDFHAREAQEIRELARARGVPYEDVLRAVDDDLHARGRATGEARGARAVPCKPRPFYD